MSTSHPKPIKSESLVTLFKHKHFDKVSPGNCISQPRLRTKSRSHTTWLPPGSFGRQTAYSGRTRCAHPGTPTPALVNVHTKWIQTTPRQPGAIPTFRQEKLSHYGTSFFHFKLAVKIPIKHGMLFIFRVSPSVVPAVCWKLIQAHLRQTSTQLPWNHQYLRHGLRPSLVAGIRGSEHAAIYSGIQRSWDSLSWAGTSFDWPDTRLKCMLSATGHGCFSFAIGHVIARRYSETLA